MKAGPIEIALEPLGVEGFAALNRLFLVIPPSAAVSILVNRSRAASNDLLTAAWPFGVSATRRTRAP